MSEMVQRAAKAIREAFSTGDAGTWVERAAIAVITTMRQPTNEMHKAMCDCYNSPVTIWMTGIDAALSPADHELERK